MLRRLYDWTMRQAASRHAERALAVVSFAESSFFPIPPDVMLVPMCLADRSKAWRYATICTLASTVGGLAGWLIGYFLLEAVGHAIIAFYGAEQAYEQFNRAFAEWGLWLVFIAGFTPVPYKVITIASGAAAYSIPLFLIASAVGRGGRFFLVAALLWKFGPSIRDFIERRLALLMWVGLAVFVLGFAALNWLL